MSKLKRQSQGQSVNSVIEWREAEQAGFSFFARIHRFFRRLLGVKSNRSVAGDLINILVLSILGFFMVMPMVYSISNAFKPLDELFLYPPRFLVRNPTFDNFRDLGTLMSNSWVPMSRYIFNTVFITIVGTALHVILASMAAYVLEKHDFYGAKPFFSLVTFALLFNGTVTAIPSFIIMSQLHLVNTHAALILPAVGSTLGLFLMKQFMGSVHDTILEAAKIDGAGELSLFFRMVMPMVKPAWLTLIIFAAQGLWNSTGGTLIRSEELKPLAFALGQITSGGIARAGAGAAVSVVLMIVPISVFIFTQTNILDTMGSSGIKE
ncbi:MAG: carbohydrate ABC transporter permease [Oscillospiraceae bacterium]